MNIKHALLFITSFGLAQAAHFQGYKSTGYGGINCDLSADYSFCNTNGINSFHFYSDWGSWCMYLMNCDDGSTFKTCSDRSISTQRPTCGTACIEKKGTNRC
ncbi:hypothetical protein BKA57DRAFT_467335 [Linnemannia elongata]|nr:hypothetical protein BKA57DRAFT_467335 [Linnemannia elongata]